MRDLDYYTIRNWDLPNKRDLFQVKLRELDEIPMTKKEREDAEKQAQEEVNEIYLKERKKYQEAQNKLDAEFYIDCREDLGYDKFLNEEGCKALESYAYQEGHSGGCGEIYNQLSELTDLAQKLVDNRKKK